MRFSGFSKIRSKSKKLQKNYNGYKKIKADFLHYYQKMKDIFPSEKKTKGRKCIKLAIKYTSCTKT